MLLSTLLHLAPFSTLKNPLSLHEEEEECNTIANTGCDLAKVASKVQSHSHTILSKCLHSETLLEQFITAGFQRLNYIECLLGYNANSSHSSKPSEGFLGCFGPSKEKFCKLHIRPCYRCQQPSTIQQCLYCNPSNTVSEVLRARINQHNF